MRVCPRSAGARLWPQQMSSDHNYRVIYGGTCMCTSMHGGQPINNQLSNTKQTWRTLGLPHANIHCSCANFSTTKEYSRWVCLSWALLLNFLCCFKLLTGQFSRFFLCGYVIHTHCLHLMTKPSILPYNFGNLFQHVWFTLMWHCFKLIHIATTFLHHVILQ